MYLIQSQSAYHLSRSVANLQLDMIYDYTVQGREDPLMNDTEKVLHFLTTILGSGAYLVDAFPFREPFYLSYGAIPDADATQ